MKCTNFILQIILIYEIYVTVNSLQQVLPNDISKFTGNSNIDNYQNVLRYYQLLNSVNNINNAGMNNPLIAGNGIAGLNNLNNLSNLSNLNNQINPQLVNYYIK